MKNNLVNVTLHGCLGEVVGQNWNLAAKSLSECIRFIEMNTKKLYTTLYDFDKKNIKYQVIINGRNFNSQRPISLEEPETIFESELAMIHSDLKTIDIVPILEGADSDIFQAILGVILIVVGAVTSWAGGVALIAAGLTLLASGVIGLLSSPPKFEDFREIEQGGKSSYLFAGPANIVGEGGPVPTGYGRAIIGSQVISAAYVIQDFDTSDTSVILRDEYGDLIRIQK